MAMLMACLAKTGQNQIRARELTCKSTPMHVHKEEGDHSWLLGDDIDLLPFLLLPLAGGEEYGEDEVEVLPPDLQYLPEDKQREPDPDIRKMLIECLQLLCATPDGRRILKGRGTYLILRSLDSWETEADVKRSCEKVIQILIGDEPESGLENLLEVSVPPEVEKQLKRLDEEEERAQQEEAAKPLLMHPMILFALAAAAWHWLLQ
ncbi:unnamed protein product, partial [Ranitomeya imitator]